MDWLNAEGYPDPTAAEAIENVTREEMRKEWKPCVFIEDVPHFVEFDGGSPDCCVTTEKGKNKNRKENRQCQNITRSTRK